MLPKLLPTLALALAALPACAADRSTDPLAPVVQCLADGDFKLAQQQRLPATSTSRQVATAAGNYAVSTADGYRLLVHKASSAPLVNLKVELSAPGKFAADRVTVLAQLREMSNKRPPGMMALTLSEVNGVEVMAVNNPTIERGGPISLYTLAHEGSGVISTAYILSQPKEVREFGNYEQYAALRDQFIAKLAGCLAAQN
ncbi:hypothetical protein LJR289_003485 [Pseudoduganella sp. LjRoot289]|uniref:hypothetical protein n=1 Tax=Pseudoduganella sp. LjRoot289 TaxID=3342314 RepID=UPI003ECCCFD8